MSKRIQFDISANEIQRAIDEVKNFKTEFLKKVDTYRKKVTEEIAVQASTYFGSAIVDDIVNGSPRTANVTVTYSDNGTIGVVVADGDDAVWCEFGAGVYHNGAVGTSPHPSGSQLGFTIGTYGKGHGVQKVWGYYTDPVNKTGLVITRGTPASMPLYNAGQDVLNRAVTIARGVFN